MWHYSAEVLCHHRVLKHHDLPDCVIVPRAGQGRAGLGRANPGQGTAGVVLQLAFPVLVDSIGVLRLLSTAWQTVHWQALAVRALITCQHVMFSIGSSEFTHSLPLQCLLPSCVHVPRFPFPFP